MSRLNKTADAPLKTNALPKYLDKSSKAKTGNAFGSADDATYSQPPDVTRLIEQNKLPVGGNLKKAIEVRNAQSVRQREKQAEMFDVDHKSLDIFSLPGKPETSSIVPPSYKSKAAKAVRVSTVTEETVEPEPQHEFHFLGKTMDIDVPPKPVTTEIIAAHKGGQTGQAQSSSDLDRISSIMENIKTGDDAINFFARFGADSPVKFVHLYPYQNPKLYRPYDLVVIEESQNPVGEHFTMSSAGIVHICPGEQSECIPLANWMRQSMMFNILRNIPFYKYYLHCKAFTIWRDNVRFQLFTKQRKKVVEKLFLARNSTCAPFLEVKKQLLVVQKVQLLHLELKTTDKDAFMDHVNAQCIKAGLQFEESTRKIITEVQNVIMEVTNMHTNMHSDAAVIDSGGQEKTKSLVKIIQEKQERKALRARSRLEYNSLPDFIRLVDYLTVETLVVLTINTVQVFYEELMKTRKIGLFETFVRFGTTNTYFQPTCIDFREMMDRLLDLMVTTVGNVNRVSYLSHKLSPLGPNVQAIIRENRQFMQLSDQLQFKINSDFDRATEHVQSFDSIRPIYDFNLTWDFEAYRAQQHDIASLKSMLERINNWNKELDKLRNKNIGILDVDAKRLRSELIPLRDARLAEIKDYIKDIAR